MITRIFQLKINGKVLGKVSSHAESVASDFIPYAEGFGFDETKDVLEIEDITDNDISDVLDYKSSQDEMPIKSILTRHVSNLIVTYGEDEILNTLKDIIRVKKAS